MRYLIALCVTVVIKSIDVECDSLHSSYEDYVALIQKTQASAELTEQWDDDINSVPQDPLGLFADDGLDLLSIECGGSHRSAVKPTSVHTLKAGDIDIVAGLGDSLSAALGAKADGVFGLLYEWRGNSWSIGGDNNLASGTSTLPNILKMFNPNVKGYSTGVHFFSSGDALNVAVSGAIVQDMPKQANNLVAKLKADTSINFDEDWKMITLFIGGNNLCAYCKDVNAHSAATYKQNIQDALDILKLNVPRAYVNLVEIFDISPIAGLGTNFVCSLVHSVVCSCGHGDNADTVGISSLSKEYQKAVQELVESGRYDGTDDFTVVNQPFFRDTVPPARFDGTPDLSYFAPDCFHFSEKGHNSAGKGLWNNIVSPIGKKRTTWGLTDALQCPGTYLPTKNN